MASDTVLLKAETRKELGSKHAEKLRKEGKLPVIIYGHKQEPVALTLNLHDFTEAMHHGQRLLDIETDGKSEKLLVKDLQYDYLGKKIIHADMVRVSLTEKIKITIPLEFKGVSAGSHQGDLLDEHLDHLEIECTVTQLPGFIEVSVRDLDIGDNLHARDIELAPGITLVTDPEALIVACHLPVVKEVAEVEELEEAEETTEPEVITESKRDEEGEEQDKK
jgi:large subunit ribosomal protein L25